MSYNNHVLFLTIKKEPFEAILGGHKLKEFRDKKEYWRKRLFHSDGLIKWYDEVFFRNGYSKDAPFCRVRWMGLLVREKFEILLGKIIEVGNLDGN